MSVAALHHRNLASAVAPAQVRAAKASAAGPHALVNLVRLVRGLETRAPGGDVDDSPGLEVVGSAGKSGAAASDWNTLLYARALLDALQEQNEQSSSTSTTLTQLSTTLDQLTERYSAHMSPLSPSAPLSRVQSRVQPAASTSIPAVVIVPQLVGGGSALISAQSNTHASSTTAAHASTSARDTDIRARLRRNRPNIDAYLAERTKEDAAGGESGLLPLHRARVSDGKDGAQDMEKEREELLRSQTSRTAMGGVQLHEELGGQLAQMSHRLKLNAMHFANSLEEEKAILEASQQALEGNLVGTQSSKTHLSAVTRKGRGTTCMTLGVVLLVLVIFVWTYMLIRFT